MKADLSIDTKDNNIEIWCLIAFLLEKIREILWKKEISASIIKDYTPKDLMLIYTFAAEICSFIIMRGCAAYEF